MITPSFRLGKVPLLLRILLAQLTLNSMIDRAVVGSEEKHASGPPNIVLMVIDDLGWTDVGYHGSDFPTPNIDRLAHDGVRLENYYVQQVPPRSPLRACVHTRTRARARALVCLA